MNVFMYTRDQKTLEEANRLLDDEIQELKLRVGQTVGYAKLTQAYCSVCYLSECDDAHKVIKLMFEWICEFCMRVNKWFKGNNSVRITFSTLR